MECNFFETSLFLAFFECFEDSDEELDELDDELEELDDDELEELDDDELDELDELDDESVLFFDPAPAAKLLAAFPSRLICTPIFIAALCSDDSLELDELEDDELEELDDDELDDESSALPAAALTFNPAVPCAPCSEDSLDDDDDDDEEDEELSSCLKLSRS